MNTQELNMPKENSSKDVSADDSKEWTIEDHMSHILALKNLTKSQLKSAMVERKLTSSEFSQLENERWDLAHQHVALGTSGKGWYTLKPQLWKTLEPEHYPYSEKDRQRALSNISRKLNGEYAPHQRDSQSTTPKSKDFLKRSNPEPTSETAPTKRSKSTETFWKAQVSGPDASYLGRKTYLEQSKTHSLGNQLTEAGQTLSSQSPTNQAPARQIPELNSNLESPSCKVGSGTYSYPLVKSLSTSQQARTIQRLDTLAPKLSSVFSQPSPISPTTREKSSKSEVSKPLDNETVLNLTIAVGNSDFSTKGKDVLQRTNAFSQSTINTGTGSSQSGERKSGDWRRAQGFTEYQNSSGFSMSSNLGSSKLSESTKPMQATCTQVPVSYVPHNRTNYNAEPQNKELEVIEKASRSLALETKRYQERCQEAEAKLNTFQRALQLKNQQCQKLQSALEEAQERLKVTSEASTGGGKRLVDLALLIDARDAELKSLKAQLEEANESKDGEIQGLKDKLKEANETTMKWVVEDEVTARRRQEQVKLRPQLGRDMKVFREVKKTMTVLDR